MLEAAAQPQNAASISILTKLGVRYVGDRSEFTPNRGRNETCAYFELRRPTYLDLRPIMPQIISERPRSR